MCAFLFNALTTMSSEFFVQTRHGHCTVADQVADRRQKGKAGPYSITELRVPELILVHDSRPANDVSHKPGGRLPLLSVRPAVTPATLKRAATSFAAW